MDTMTREEENDNAQLALEFTKEFNECIKKQVPKECAALAVLHDLADWKDEHPRKGLWNAEKACEWLKENLYHYIGFESVHDAEIEDAINLIINDFKKAMAEYIYPEFKESEDEKIRKEIIESLQRYMPTDELLKEQEMIDWLENLKIE